MTTFIAIEIILFSVIGVCFLVQLLYYLLYFAKPVRYGKKVLKRSETEDVTLKNANNDLPGISVIVCAKNESENLKQFLPTLLTQDYPQYEVIVVNDGSTDTSDEDLKMLAGQYPHLYSTYIPENAKYLSRKKLAITIGLKAAKYPYLLFIEPNCFPVSKNWIKLMARHFNNQTDIVLGFSAFFSKNGFWSKYASYDNLFSGLKYLSFALSKKPYKGIGRNMAYKKELYFSSKGFATHLNLYPGEDDLFVNQCANQTNTAVEISPESITAANIADFGYWKETKLCQFTTQRYYRSGPIAFWNLELFSRIFFYLSFIALIVFGWPDWKFPVIAGVFYFLRLGIQLWVIHQSSAFWAIEKFHLTLPWFDFFQPVVDLYFYIARIFKGKKDYTWR